MWMVILMVLLSSMIILKKMIVLMKYADYAGYADKIEGTCFPEKNGYYDLIQYEPLGVCAGISAWNATMM